MSLCVLPPGVEIQGWAEVPQFWGESHWAQELETILPPLVLPGPETFSSRQLFFTALLCRHLNRVHVCENGGKETGGSSLRLAVIPSSMTRAITACQHVPMQIDLNPMNIICKCLFHCQKLLPIPASVHWTRVLPSVNFSSELFTVFYSTWLWPPQTGRTRSRIASPPLIGESDRAFSCCGKSTPH